MKKNFLKKKNLPADLCGYDLQNRVRKFFFNKWFSRYLSFGEFKVPKKLFFTIKLLIKLDRQKEQENATHGFGDNYLTNHLAKFLQDKIKP